MNFVKAHTDIKLSRNCSNALPKIFHCSFFLFGKWVLWWIWLDESEVFVFSFRWFFLIWFPHLKGKHQLLFALYAFKLFIFFCLMWTLIKIKWKCWNDNNLIDSNGCSVHCRSDDCWIVVDSMPFFV